MNAGVHNLDYRSDDASYNRNLHRMALLVLWATFPLIFIGGLVTSKDAGLSVPDWPNSYGYNMFLFPPRLWNGGIFYEHVHRLDASLVGLLTVVLAVWAWKGEKRKWVRTLALSCLVMVIIQGILGGLRVRLLKLNLAIVHACVAQAFFCMAMLMCLVTSKWWTSQVQGDSRSRETNPGRGLVRLAVVAWVIVFMQLMLAATMRHYRAGLAIPDVPLAFGKLIPPTNAADLAAAQQRFAPTWYEADESTLAQVWLAFGHRIGALVVSCITITLAAMVLWRHRKSGLIAPAVFLLVLLAAQLTLGVLTVLWKKPADIASAHVAVGALVLVTTFVLAVRSMRVYPSAAFQTRFAGNPTDPSFQIAGRPSPT